MSAIAVHSAGFGLRGVALARIGAIVPDVEAVPEIAALRAWVQSPVLFAADAERIVTELLVL